MCSNRVNFNANWKPGCLLITASNRVSMSFVTFTTHLVFSLVSWVAGWEVDSWLPFGSGFTVFLVVDVGSPVVSSPVGAATSWVLGSWLYINRPCRSVHPKKILCSCTMKRLKSIECLRHTQYGVLLMRPTVKTLVFTPCRLIGILSLPWKGSECCQPFLRRCHCFLDDSVFKWKVCQKMF